MAEGIPLPVVLRTTTDRVRLGLIEHDQSLYLAGYDFESR